MKNRAFTGQIDMMIHRDSSRAGKRKSRPDAFTLALIISCATCAPCAPAAQEPDITARQALASSIEKFMKWKSYRYRGTSKLVISGHPGLSNSATFDTRLRVNGEGGVDGHMVVKAPAGGSYEEYSRKRITYRKIEGGEWERNSSRKGTYGAAMVSLTARRIIAAFAELVEDVRFIRVTAGEYEIACTMGEKYSAGARKIAGTGTHEHTAPVPGGKPSKGSVMHITVDRKTLEMKRIWMKAEEYNQHLKGTVATITDGTYTEINEPQDIEPVPEALNAPGAAN